MESPKALIPIIEPEVDIKSPQKSAAEQLLLNGLRERIAKLPIGSKVILKLTLTEGLNAAQSQSEFERVLDSSIESIFQASH